MAEQHATSASAPLLGGTDEGAHDQQQQQHGEDDYSDDEDVSGWHWSRRLRRTCGRALASRRKHFIIMAVVALDVTTLLANIFIQLIACETNQADEPWVEAMTTTLEVIGLVFSTVFMIELIACIYAFGWEYVLLCLFDNVFIFPRRFKITRSKNG